MSLTTRLTVLFAGVLVLVLAGFSWLVFKETSTRFHELDQSLLLAKVQLVKDLAKESESEEELLGRLETSTRGHVGLYFSARNTYGAVFEQGDMQIPSELLKDLNVDNRRVKLRHDAHSLYAQRFEVLLQGDRRKPVSVVAAVDTKQHSQFLDSLAIKTRGYIGFSVLIGTLLGWMASRGGLSPLTTLRASAERLNANRLSERIPARSWPTEMMELSRSLNGMLGRLQRDFDRLSGFSANLAHEMRTPVSNLLTAAQVTLAQPRSSAEYRNTLATISEELQDLARTISDMLFLAKTENLHALPSVEQVDLGAESRSLVDFYEVVASEKGLNFDVAGEGRAHGDRLMIRRAMSNLLSNAVRHADPMSTVQVLIESTPEKVSLAVRNKGEEIPVEAQSAMFDRFVRLEPVKREQSDGLGLGLAITKAIMRAHHGSVKVLSEKRANTFVLEFTR
jgi:two-component system heavy metal sensor histidine kinase CusS